VIDGFAEVSVASGAEDDQRPAATVCRTGTLMVYFSEFFFPHYSL
jgi:hypothetical protein